MTAAIPKQTVVWDERRNSSRVFPVPPTALPEAEAALESFKRSQPDLYGWVASGAPNLSHGQHLSLFGEPFKAARAKKAGAPLRACGLR